MWKTPQKHDEREQGKKRPIVNGRIQTHSGDSTSINLAMQVQQWPTPNKMDAERGAECKETKAARNAGGVNLREACN
jgi:hypothetical protein